MPSEAQIKYMAERFLNWKLPDPWHPDGGISFQPEFNVEHMAKQGLPPMRHEPTGTNLFDYTQAMAMVRHMAEGLPDPATPAGDDALVKLEHESVMASAALGAWLSAALDDPKVCDAMKADINRWFSAGHLYVEEAHRREAAAHAAGVVEERAKVVAWLRRCGEGRPTNSDDHIAAASAFTVSADAIERGQNKETGDADQV